MNTKPGFGRLTAFAAVCAMALGTASAAQARIYTNYGGWDRHHHDHSSFIISIALGDLLRAGRYHHAPRHRYYDPYGGYYGNSYGGYYDNYYNNGYYDNYYNNGYYNNYYGGYGPGYGYYDSYPQYSIGYTCYGGYDHRRRDRWDHDHDWHGGQRGWGDHDRHGGWGGDHDYDDHGGWDRRHYYNHGGSQGGPGGP